MEIVYFIAAIILIFSGIKLIEYYHRLKKENKAGGLSFKLQTVGIGLILIGIAIIVRGCNDLVDYFNQWTL